MVNKKYKTSKFAQHNVLTAEFLAVKNDITKAMKDGYFAKIIWLFLKESGKIQSCYKTFLRYVKRFISPLPPQNVVNQNAENLKQSVAAAEKMNKVEEKKSLQKPEKPVFRYNPIPNEKDLI
ncbi:MAG: TraK family protein [Enterovibrio sp.]